MRHLSLSDRTTWCLLLAMIGLCGALALADGFTIDPKRALLPTVALLLLAGATLAGSMLERPRLQAGAVAFLQMSLFTVAGVVLAYVLAARGAPLWDASFAAADRRLGFDWPRSLAALDRWPALVLVLGVAYHSLVVQMIVVIVALSGGRRCDRLRAFASAAVASGFATILISGVVPAMGNLFDPAHYQHLWPSVAWLERDLVVGLRDGSHRVLDFTVLTGIVSFPSYHATLAALFIWTLSGVPRIGLPLQLWSGVTIVATPVFGGHYAVDVLAGLLLAAPAMLFAKRVSLPAPFPTARQAPNFARALV